MSSSHGSTRWRRKRTKGQNKTVGLVVRLLPLLLLGKTSLEVVWGGRVELSRRTTSKFEYGDPQWAQAIKPSVLRGPQVKRTPTAASVISRLHCTSSSSRTS